LGAEIVISGKLSTERARFEKFRAGYFPRCGDPALTYMKKAEAHVQLKPGIIGVRVKLMPPDAQFPDKIKVTEEVPPSENEEIPAEETEAEMKAKKEKSIEKPGSSEEKAEATQEEQEKAEEVAGEKAEETEGEAVKELVEKEEAKE
jgi:small subunit ribosomal protein S3